MKRKKRLCLVVWLFTLFGVLLFTTNSIAQTDTTWHPGATGGTMYSTNQVEIRNGLTVKGTVIADTLKSTRITADTMKIQRIQPLDGDSILAFGRHSLYFNINQNNMYWNIDSNQFGGFSIGNGVVGSPCQALGLNSMAFGYAANTTTNAIYSAAIGASAQASGDRSIALGRGTSAIGKFSTSLGNRSSSPGDHSTALGDSATATGTSGLAIGNGVNATGTNTFVMGTNITSSAANSLTAGFGSPTLYLQSSPHRVGIATTTPDSSALLDVKATNKGLLIPRVALLNTTDGTTISGPATSLLVYNTGTGGLTPAGYWYNAGTAASPNWVLLISSGNSGSWLVTGNSIADTNFIGTINAKDFIVKTNNTERARVTSSGNVGIGTAAPSVKLHIENDQAGSIIYNRAYKTTAATADIRLGKARGTQAVPTTVVNGDALSVLYFQGYDGTNWKTPGYIECDVDNAVSSGIVPGNLQFGVTNTSGSFIEAMRIKSSGNIGIGTTTPASKLDIEGGMSLGATYSGTSSAPTNGAIIEGSVGIGITSPSAKLHVSGGGVIISDITSNNAFLKFYDNTSNCTIQTDSGRIGIFTTTNERLRILTNGNVGIGTTSPSTKLHISGDANSMDLLKLQNTNATYPRSFRLGPGAGATNIFGIYDDSAATTRLAIDYSGKVGIGTTVPSYKLDVQGDTTAFTINTNGKIQGVLFNSTSDQMFKTNVDSLNDALAIIKQLKPKSYYFDTLNFNGKGKFCFPSGKQEGFIAQEIETILPELVSYSVKPAIIDTSGNVVNPAYTYRSVNYIGLIPFLTKGIQELQQKNDSLQTKTSSQDNVITLLQNQALQSAVNDSSLQNQVNQLTLANTIMQGKINQFATNNTLIQDQLNQLLTCCKTTRAISLGADETQSQPVQQMDVKLNDVQSIVLEQNVPNPFAEQTTINYTLPDNTSKAQMLFYNSQGKLIQSVDLVQKGKGTLNVFASDLTNGVYTYSLIIDGQIIDTKKMVKAK